jgi:hypothetical protein
MKKPETGHIGIKLGILIEWDHQGTAWQAFLYHSPFSFRAG